ncbi:ABC transporter permease [Kitasatospora kifunensis]|uniref:Putative ABC transport system permease protein n=1 Tax=Kitasatospora kifunensis TaxID=58351 RepID=A0A7W7QWK3_KITKI|nr:FtsX-like permease family protein [Kitasatospora kifunensis]MBB4921108.1 putative ABC transport system permease protein [Kitasatospora kifunensis]
MSAVWLAARAAARRRRLQTIIIGIVVLLSTSTLVIALALVDAASAPFDQAFAAQRGAQVVAAFDTTKVSDAQLAQTARQPGVVAAAGPYGQAVLNIAPGSAAFVSGPLTVVGRADPAGPVDRVNLWEGRWATGPGEIVVNWTPPADTGAAPLPLGQKLTAPGGAPFTIVGYAYSLSRTADAWVSPEQVAAMHPSATQMLYRFSTAATNAEISADVASVTAGLPADSVLASQSYLTVKQAVAAGPGAYVPFLMVFGFLGLLVAVLIVANIISGAVVSGLRHIGILKSLGFTPRQVVAVYLLMVSLPSVAGCVLGTVVGNLATGPLLANAFQGLGMDQSTLGVSPWVDAAALLGMPAVVLLAALVPALRAHRLSAAQAISAGSAPRTGRGLAVQRRLSGTRLPRSVSLGLGLPFARPGRTALTTAAVLLGVTTATFATGMINTVTKYADAVDRPGASQITVQPADPRFGRTPSKLSDPATEALLRGLPGARHVTADAHVPVSLVGYTQGVTVDFLRGDSATLRFQDEIVKGRWLNGPGEIVLASAFMNQRGLAVGDHLTLEVSGKQTRVTIVGATMYGSGPVSLFCDWQTLAPLTGGVKPAESSVQYLVQLAPGTSTDAYLGSIRAADPGFEAWAQTGTNNFTVATISLSTVLTLMLSAVAALGVFNTVVLNTRERRRDLGMLKSIGMTPRQVIVMMVTSMAALGAVGGLLGIPLGIVAHRLIIPATAHAADVDLPQGLMDVWHAPVLALLALAGIAIAVVGAFLPARATARLTIAQALHNE